MRAGWTRVLCCLGSLLLSARAAEPGDAAGAWWRGMFSIAFDGHGNFICPHLDTLNATAASLVAVGFHGAWDADLNRDLPWLRGHLAAFAKRPATKRVVYIECASASGVLCRVAADGRVLFTATVLEGLDDPGRRAYVDRLVKADGRTTWFGDWQFVTSQPLRSSLGAVLPGAAELGLKPFLHPLTGAPITGEAEFWRTRSARPLVGKSGGSVEKHLRLSAADAARLGLAAVTSQRADGQWLVERGESMLYDAQFAPYQAAKARRALQVFAPDMIHYDDWDLRSPTLFTGRADVHVAAFRAFVARRFTDEDCRTLGFAKTDVAGFDVLRYLLNPPWRGDYPGDGDGPQWRCAADPRWLSDKVWRAFQIACVDDRLASMKEVYRLTKQAGRDLLGRDVPVVANVIPTLSALFLQHDCVDMPNFEWPCFKTYGAFPEPFGYYPQARLGIGPRLASKIGVTGQAIVDPYVEPQYSGWDGRGFTSRHGETLHKVIYFDLVANRGIPAFGLTWDGGYSPGSVHSAGQLHAFINEVAPVISRREYLADIGLAASSWSQIAAQPPFGGWNHEVAKRHLAEFLGWAQYLAAAPDFPQWDVVPFDGVRPEELARFGLVVLPSVLVIGAEHRVALASYLGQGGRLLVTGETGAFSGPDGLLLPQPQNPIAALTQRHPGQVTITTAKPGVDYHLDPAKSAALSALLLANAPRTPVLTAANAPDHVGICVSVSRTDPGDITVDLVNYRYDLASDTLTPVTAGDFTLTLHTPRLADPTAVTLETIRYDESAPGNTARQTLDASAFTVAAGTLTLRVPPFTHYQVVRITCPGAVAPRRG